jgi:hypothetical protein
MPEEKKDVAASYNKLKTFGGKRYTGMKVGGRHKWQYEAGEWREQKVTPDEWSFTYAVKKRRAGHAPEGSGAPVGTGYNWYIVATQVVKKLDANTYSTEMVGAKHKVAHMRASQDSWNVGEKTMKKRMAQILEETAARLRAEAEGEVVAEAEPEEAPKAKAGRRPSRAGRKTSRRTKAAMRSG